MWNIVNELTKREHGLLRRPFSNDCCGSKFMLKHMELQNYQKIIMNQHQNIKFNHNGDLFSFFDFDAAYIWDTLQRKEKFKIDTNPINDYGTDDFRILNNFSKQNDVDFAIANTNKVEFKTITPAGDIKTKQTISLFENDETTLKLALCPTCETQIYCKADHGSLYHFDLRSDPAKKNWFYQWHGFQPIFEHDPIKTELCMAGSDSIVRIFDTRKLREPLTEYNLAPFKEFTACTYNYNGSEILVSSERHSREGRTHLIYNDNTANKFSTYDIRFRFQASFYGPKSEFLSYLRAKSSKEDLSSRETDELVFLNKLSKEDNQVELALDMPFYLYKGSTLSTHPNKPLILAHLETGTASRVVFIATQGTYDDKFLDFDDSSSSPESESAEEFTDSEELVWP